MSVVSIEDAGAQLAELIKQLESGDEVLITDDDHLVAKLVPVTNGTASPKPGSAKDKIIYMADDFDAPLEDFAEYM